MCFERFEHSKRMAQAELLLEHYPEFERNIIEGDELQ